MQRSISGRAWDVVAGFEVAYATTAGDQIRVPLVDARGRCGWSRFRLFAGSARIEGNAIWSVVVGHR